MLDTNKHENMSKRYSEYLHKHNLFGELKYYDGIGVVYMSIRNDSFMISKTFSIEEVEQCKDASFHWLIDDMNLMKERLFNDPYRKE